MSSQALEEALAQDDDTSIALRLTRQVCAAFSRLNLFIGYREECPPDEARLVRIPKAARFEEYTSFLGDFHTVGAFSYAETPSLAADLGRYCSVASNVAVFGERHPIERVTSSSITYCFAPAWNKPQFARAHRVLMGGRHQPDLQGMTPFVRPVIQHDVWIGQNVQLARGITIGTGAVVGAGSVVTRDVAPYTIVGGNPARSIRARFPESLADRLLATRWWTYCPSILWSLGYRDPAAFCTAFEKSAACGGLPSLSVRMLDWRDVVREIGQSRADADTIEESGRPRTLMTKFGTPVFVDQYEGLRHGWRAPEGALVLVSSEAARLRLDCSAATDVTVRAADPERDPSVLHGVFERVVVSNGSFGLRRAGLFLCAEPDGRVSLSRTELGPWESFRLGDL